MRFRKRVKLAKGLYINLSGSGVSLSAGVRGASVTIGKNGAYLNTGIPGTGLSSRTKIGVGSTPKQIKRSGPIVSKGANDNLHISISLNDLGEPILEIKDSLGIPVMNESILRKVKQTDKYKETIQRLISERKGNIEAESEQIINIYKQTPSVSNAIDIERLLSELHCDQYEIKEYPVPCPTEELVVEDLTYEASQYVRSWFFWKNKKLRQEYIHNNLKERLTQRISTWQKNRDEFEKKEQLNKAAKDIELRDEYNKNKNHLNNLIRGPQDFVNSQVEAVLSEISLPVQFSVDYDYSESEGTLFFDLDLPEIEDFPIKKASILQSGKLSIKTKTDKEIRSDYATCVCGMAFYFAGLMFDISTNISKVVISAYSQRVSKATGNVEDEYLYSVVFDRERFMKLNIDKIDPITSISSFPSRIKMMSNYDLKPIEPLVSTSLV